MVDSRLIRFVKVLEKDFKKDNLDLYEEDRLEFFRKRREHIDQNMHKFNSQKDESQ